MRVAVFCEAAADFRTITDLVARVLREEGPDWVRDHLDARPLDEILAWVGAAPHAFFDVHHVYAEASARKIALPRNNFQGQRGGAGALLAHTAWLVARSEADRSGSVDAMILVWDMDDQGEARREGLEQGRDSVPLPTVLGCPNPEREAWVLAGFVPENAAERERLEEERKSLRFDPCAEAHRLRDKDEGALRSIKRVLAVLTSSDRDREARCVTDSPLATLRARGVESGLAAFFDEIAERLGALFDPRKGQR
jgi:hypothetical protein